MKGEYSNDQLVTEEGGKCEENAVARVETVKGSTNAGDFHVIHRCSVDVQGDNLLGKHRM